MGYPRRIQNSTNGRVKGSLSGAYSRNYNYYDCKNDEKHSEEILNSSEEKASIINPANLLNIEKDKASASSMVGEPSFFKEVEGELKKEILSKTLAPGA